MTRSRLSEPSTDPSRLRVAVVGAGPSGLAAARTFLELGMRVTVFESAPDVGGVWSATRRYPGVTTQNTAPSYGFSDAAITSAAPVPTGAEVQAHLEAFAARTGVEAVLHRATRVEDAHREGDEWVFDAVAADGRTRHRADWLVVATGLFSQPHVPAFEGLAEFERAGGRVLPPSSVGDGEVLRSAHVLVVGWGKSAADLAVAATGLAASVTVVVRRLNWKLPRRIAGVFWERVLLSRGGEFLLWGHAGSRAGRAAAVAVRPLSAVLVALLRLAVVAQQGFWRRGLFPIPGGDHGIDHVMSAGLLDAIDDRRVVVRGGRRIAALRAEGGERTAVLDDGTVLPADVVVAATGFDRDLRLFGPEARASLVDADGRLVLQRYTLAEALPNLAIVGWTGSFRSPFSSEAQSWWLGAAMLGALPPADAERDRHAYLVDRRSADAAGDRPPSASYAVVDRWLADLGLQVPLRRRLGELVGPIDPSVYREVLPALRRQLVPPAAAPEPVPVVRPAGDVPLLG